MAVTVGMSAAQYNSRRNRREALRWVDADLAAFFKNALEADRKVWVTCSHCDRRTEAEIPDWTARAKAVEMMLNQGFGRPPSGGPDGDGVMIVHRTIVLPDGTPIASETIPRVEPPPAA